MMIRNSLVPSLLLVVAALDVLLSSQYTNAFQCATTISSKTMRKQSSPSQMMLAADDDKIQSADDLLQSDNWKNSIKRDLDQVPIFTVATAEGHPLAYKVENSRGVFEVPTFYCDIEAAKQELSDVKNGMKDQPGAGDGIDLIPFPLGQAFQLWSKSEAMIIPGANAVLQAGAPPGTNPIGQNVPLFGCMEIMEEREDGKAVLPLFLSLEDANAAVQLAVDADGGNANDFEVIAMSLNRAVEQLVSEDESSMAGFHFIPPSASMKYIQDYLS